MKWRYLRIGARLTFATLLLCGIVAITSEWIKSRRESHIAAEVVEKGGYILRPIRSIQDIVDTEKTEEENKDKPVFLVMRDNTFSRMFRGYLGVRIDTAHINPTASNEFASVLKDSTSLLNVMFVAPHDALSPAPCNFVQILSGAPIPQYVFNRCRFGKLDIVALSNVSNLGWLFFVNCDMSIEAVNELRLCRKLKSVTFAGCNFNATDDKINQSLDALRKANIEVIYKRIDDVK